MKKIGLKKQLDPSLKFTWKQEGGCSEFNRNSSAICLAADKLTQPQPSEKVYGFPNVFLPPSKSQPSIR